MTYEFRREIFVKVIAAIAIPVGKWIFGIARDRINSKSNSEQLAAQDFTVSDKLDSDVEEIFGGNIYYKRKFSTLDVEKDFDRILKGLQCPSVFFVIEDRPSTAWHLPVVVVEDQITLEWFIFSKGRIAFEGSGGGLAQARSLMKKLGKDKIPTSAWVLDQILTEKLSQGCRPWPEYKHRCIPAHTAIVSAQFHDHVVCKFFEIANQYAQPLSPQVA